jgi:metal-dependent HD superfamily phosphatase/phosphodiesterase
MSIWEENIVTKKKKLPQIKIHVPLEGNDFLRKTLDIVNSNKEVNTLWGVINVNAMDRLKMPDHGPVHFQIVANIALRFTRILVDNNIKMSIVKDFELTNNHAELVILLTALFHDLGMSIERKGHEDYSLFLTNNILRETLGYLPIEERTIVVSETLHAIISHRSGGNPKTLEAGIVRVADALDMSEGRSRIPYEEGNVDIHSVSAAAIDNVEIRKGIKKPIQINILMNNSAGLFQVDELLKRKIIGSGIENYVDVKAYVARKKEKKLIKEFTIKGL